MTLRSVTLVWVNQSSFTQNQAGVSRDPTLPLDGGAWSLDGSVNFFLNSTFDRNSAVGTGGAVAYNNQCFTGLCLTCYAVLCCAVLCCAALRCAALDHAVIVLHQGNLLSCVLGAPFWPSMRPVAASSSQDGVTTAFAAFARTACPTTASTASRQHLNSITSMSQQHHKRFRLTNKHCNEQAANYDGST